MNIKNVVIIGSGTMGNGIAQTFALFEFKVKLYDISLNNLDNAKKTILKNLERMVNKEVINLSDLQKTCNNITYTNDVNSVLNSDLVIEAVTENLEIKESIFKELDAKCPEKTIIASNTSSISITRLAARTDRPEKFMGCHFMKPAPVMQLVELVRGIATSEETIDFLKGLVKKIGKISTNSEDFPAFIVNRILMPMINEGIYALYEGVGTVESIDNSMRLGANHPMGPLELADFIGLDTCLAIMNTLHDGLADTKYRPCPLLVKYVEADWLGRKNKIGFYNYKGEKPITSLEEAITFFDIDVNEYEVTGYSCNAWDVSTKTGKKTNYQVKLSLKPREEEIDYQTIKLELDKAISIVNVKKTPGKKTLKKKLHVLIIFIWQRRFI